VGSKEEPLLGGFQLLQQIEVGPLVVGQVTPIAADEYVILSASNDQSSATS